MTFQRITRADYPRVRHILQAVVEAEEYIVLPHDSPEEDWADYLFGDENYEVWALEDDGEILGVYHLRPNQKGLGSHIANGGYLVSPTARHKGVGRRMGEHSIARAKERGFHGIQYNFVISTNTVAVNLWKSLGFEIIGTIPKGFHRKQSEYVDAYIMFRNLT